MNPGHEVISISRHKLIFQCFMKFRFGITFKTIAKLEKMALAAAPKF